MNSPPPPLTPNPDDVSATTTLITFPRPVPLLRGPIKAGPADDPSSGPYLLAFKNPRSWAVAYNSCKAHVVSQCETGSRIGCSIYASNRCKPSWWRWLLGLSTTHEFRERAKCEEIEMEACLLAAKERCSVFAKQKCVPAFKNARIQSSGADLKTVEWNEVFRLISGVSFVNRISNGIGIWTFDKPRNEFGSKSEATTVRGCDLLNSDNDDIDDYLKRMG